MPVPHEEVSSYGVIAPQGKGENGRYSVETFVEKPNPEDAPSDACYHRTMPSNTR
ncbi:MAG: sugar phosphate nucleotidyltransferase [Streptococcus thermophilus]